MDEPREEGADPAAQQAAEEWRRRFGREGHEGSYATDVEPDETEKPAEPSRTSPED